MERTTLVYLFCKIRNNIFCTGTEHFLNMDVPEEILKDLTCSSCETYLSRGPVFLQHDGEALCGRCSTPHNPAIRNKQYEATAKLLKFPCKNRELGCVKTVPYAEEKEDIHHEQTCEYRQYICPVTESSKCEWLGPKSNMLDHCLNEHPNQVVLNPTSFTHDITKSSLHTYLMVAYNLLFVLYTKISVASGKIYYCVRYLGDAEEVSNFSYTLEVKRGAFNMTKPGDVAPQGCLAIQDHLSLAVTINSLLDMLGGFDGSTFVIKVERCDEDGLNLLNEVATVSDTSAEEHLAAPSIKFNTFRHSTRDDTEECKPNSSSCDSEDGWGWWNEQEPYIPALRSCKNRGCIYEDTDKKCQKHQTYFCPFASVCRICSEDVRRSLSEHYSFRHIDVTFRSGFIWRAERTSWRWFLIDSAAVCRYRLTTYRFDLDVWSSADSKQLKRASICTLRLVDPDTEYELLFNLDTLYEDWADWRIKVETSRFPSWSRKLDVSVNIVI